MAKPSLQGCHELDRQGGCLASDRKNGAGQSAYFAGGLDSSGAIADSARVERCRGFVAGVGTGTS